MIPSCTKQRRHTRGVYTPETPGVYTPETQGVRTREARGVCTPGQEGSR